MNLSDLNRTVKINVFARGQHQPCTRVAPVQIPYNANKMLILRKILEWTGLEKDEKREFTFQRKFGLGGSYVLSHS